MKILVTGAAGFIRSALCIKLIEREDTIIGIDNHNDYYNPSLKEARLSRHIYLPPYSPLQLGLLDRKAIELTSVEHRPSRAKNLNFLMYWVI